ncbi:Uncharacterised protein [Mycobacterium tuberculosis]|nr:Uncharacterised protein [Mycobacterium tuberculosis]
MAPSEAPATTTCPSGLAVTAAMMSSFNAFTPAAID